MAAQHSPPNAKAVCQPPGYVGEASHSQIKCCEEETDLSPGKLKVVLIKGSERVDPVLRRRTDDMGNADEG